MGYKNVVNTTNAPLNVALTVRQGDTPGHSAGVKSFSVAPGQTMRCDYSGNDNPYLDAVNISTKTAGGMLTSIQDVAARGGALDNALNQNNTIRVTVQGVDLINSYSNG